MIDLLPFLDMKVLSLHWGNCFKLYTVQYGMKLVFIAFRTKTNSIQT